jgi:glycosyltransferase involved in cell wall biosynthesis
VPELSVIVPTFNRRPILAKTLARLEQQRTDADFEVIVIDNASDDGTDVLVKSLIDRSALTFRYLRENETRRISRSRNHAIAEARAPVCLFLSDDIWAGDALVARHAEFHRNHTDPGEALLGRMSTPEAAETPFMRWLRL